MSARSPYARSGSTARARLQPTAHVCALPPQHLARLCGADFARRGHGALLLTGSLTALAPLPHAAMYGATRAFVRSLALGLRDELAPHGVAVTCVLPGATDTEFASTGGIESSLIFNLP
jgi:short-subunit dehydrogenase